jgi:transcriptional regulator with XRE-family HTH domain
VTTFHARLRRLRLSQGITLVGAATATGVSKVTLTRWEAGSTKPDLTRAGAIARALNVPVAALFTDELVVAEIVVSAETVARIRKEGRPAAAETAQRLAKQLEAAIYDAATRKPIDTRAGARAKPRKTRAERLAELNARTAAKKRRTIE